MGRAAVCAGKRWFHSAQVLLWQLKHSGRLGWADAIRSALPSPRWTVWDIDEYVLVNFSELWLFHRACDDNDGVARR
ncbi:hypothetical protein SAMN05444320_11718 [Streptoalloteichus hindustanus]|uniref:Uncharacterized protein n=1 Tax=Streptoalloteichus hindustanus TaxID=2017 RepID=A0A1M5NZE5_STRHI|nr:hypothetical protein SAMN05444320_11718 [Streptoalloteichus hindustanus]